MSSNSHIYPIFDRMLSRSEREHFLNQKSIVIWLVGLSGSGKSTIAQQLEGLLYSNGYFSQILDGDNIRSGLNNNLSFSKEDRIENIRRISEVSRLYCDSGVITINSFISPTEEIRKIAREILANDYFEVFIDTPIEICEKRDVKGLYRKARKGEIQNFTGIDAPFERPTSSQLIIKTENNSIENCASQIMHAIKDRITL